MYLFHQTLRDPKYDREIVEKSIRLIKKYPSTEDTIKEYMSIQRVKGYELYEGKKYLAPVVAAQTYRDCFVNNLFVMDKFYKYREWYMRMNGYALPDRFYGPSQQHDVLPNKEYRERTYELQEKWDKVFQERFSQSVNRNWILSELYTDEKLIMYFYKVTDI